MNALKSFVLACVLATTAFLGLAEGAQAAPRQGYSYWYRARGYYYHKYYYKPYVGYGGYRMHYGVYYPSQPRYIYYYSPYTRKYWGHYDRQAGGYSMLAPADQHGRLSEIPESAFPPPGEMPPIPESNSEEGATMAKPPRPPSCAGCANHR